MSFLSICFNFTGTQKRIEMNMKLLLTKKREMSWHLGE